MRFKQYQNNLAVRAIYAGCQHYQVKGLNYSPDGTILEVSIQESKCWLLDVPKLYSHIALRECLIAGVLCSNSHLATKQGKWIAIGNPIEGALIAAGSKAKLYQSNLARLMPKIDTVVDRSELPYMATLHLNLDGKVIYLKGSVEAILSRTEQMLDGNGNLISLNSEQIQREAELMAREGMQVIAFAKKPISIEKKVLEPTEIENKLIFLGLQGIHQSDLREGDRFLSFLKNLVFGKNHQANSSVQTDRKEHRVDKVVTSE